MPRRWSLYNRMSSLQNNSLSKLLGEMELEVMGHMWRRGNSTVRDITTVLQQERPVAYTTVMTVMQHLAEKGLLTRTALDKKTHLYHVALDREAFLARASQQMVDMLVADFGDLALAQFLEVVEQVDPQKLEQLRDRLAQPKPSALQKPHFKQEAAL